MLQAIRVLRNGEYAPYIVFIAAPTIATLQEVHRVSAPLYRCCLCLYIFSDPLGWAFSFDSNSCFVLRIIGGVWLRSRFLLLLKFFFFKVGTNKFYLNLFRVFFYSRIEIYSAQGIFYILLYYMYILFCFQWLSMCIYVIILVFEPLHGIFWFFILFEFSGTESFTHCWLRTLCSIYSSSPLQWPSTTKNKGYECKLGL